MNGAPGTTGLGGRGILVTRPSARAGGLCRLISEAGGEPVAFPTLEIVSIPDAMPYQQRIGGQNTIKLDPHAIIFVSPTAVALGHAAIPRQWLDQAVVAAVGAATAVALRERGVQHVIAPAGQADSEALAALPAFQAGALAGRQVLIVRGQGGREWLADTLRSRGARVDYFECYRRARPQTDTAPLLASWRAGGIAAVTVTSAEALVNLDDMLGPAGAALLRATPMFVVHERIAARARVLGVQQIRVTGAGDAAMVAGLQRFFATVA